MYVFYTPAGVESDEVQEVPLNEPDHEEGTNSHVEEEEAEAIEERELL